jgi:hypothetical protein
LIATGLVWWQGRNDSDSWMGWAADAGAEVADCLTIGLTRMSVLLSGPRELGQHRACLIGTRQRDAAIAIMPRATRSESGIVGGADVGARMRRQEFIILVSEARLPRGQVTRIACPVSTVVSLAASQAGSAKRDPLLGTAARYTFTIAPRGGRACAMESMAASTSPGYGLQTTSGRLQRGGFES